MKNKKGFTLIELLAVIIILAVIALIATPVVLNVVENAKKEANKNSVYGLLDAAKLYYADSMLDETKKQSVNGTTNLMEVMTVSGRKPDSGEIYINNKGETALAVVYDDVCYKKDFAENNLTESEDVDNCKIQTDSVSETIYYYEFGEPTTSSTTDYTTLNKNIFVRLSSGGEKSLCIIYNDNLECFKNNYDEEKEHIVNVLGANNCKESSAIECSTTEFNCAIYSGGWVSCYSNVSSQVCDVYDDGNAECS